MHRQVNGKRILFVDDEPSIRLTLPPVLEQNGFELRVAATVPDALFEINSYNFDVLLCDLNISEEGDGFLVVSAMRHLKPDCVNLILTGFPALESALQAIRNQVDDYLVKPVDLDLVLRTIRDRLETRRSKPLESLKRLSTTLKENRTQIAAHALRGMRQHPKLASLSLSGGERIDQLAKLLDSLIERFELEGDDRNTEMQRLGVEYGRQRKDQGYAIPMIIIDFQVCKQAIYDVILNHLVEMELGRLLSDLREFQSRLDFVIQKSLEPYARAKRSSAATH